MRPSAKLLFAGIFLLFFPLGPWWGGERGAVHGQIPALTKEKKTEESEARQGNIYNLIFGSAPSMPTQRGLLVIHAFHDRNGNRKKDDGEEFLRNEVACLVDGIRYRVPAFIPALKLHQSYEIRCFTIENFNNFRPIQSEEEIFVERRGQVFDIGLPCELLEKAPPVPLPDAHSATPSRN